MKRSQINRAICDLTELAARNGFALPPFSNWTREDWTRVSREYDELRDNMLGWDVTDFGSGDFAKVGLTLFTVRNGNLALRDKYPKMYAEKLMMVDGRQVTPYHYHVSKTEDIINRGEGTLEITLYNAAPDDSLADTDVTVYADGRRYTAPAGVVVKLSRGESVTLMPRVYHTFRGADERQLLVGEVSFVNDDRTDNRFLEPAARFSTIEEDEPAIRLLSNEYPEANE